MQKEEVLALIDRLYLDQNKYNRFLEYLDTFLGEPRCKKGCIAFVKEVFNDKEVEGLNLLAMKLTSTKSDLNAYNAVEFVREHVITLGYNQALTQARVVILKAVRDYVLDTSRRLSETTLLDKIERQVYLRRAVGRLLTMFSYTQHVVVKREQWPEIQVDGWIDYLNNDLETLAEKIVDENAVKRWSVPGGDVNNLDRGNTLAALKSYLDYLDTFVEY